MWRRVGSRHRARRDKVTESTQQPRVVRENAAATQKGRMRETKKINDRGKIKTDIPDERLKERRRLRKLHLCVVETDA